VTPAGRQREACLELAWRAAFSPGLIGRLVRKHGSMKAVLELSPARYEPLTGRSRRPPPVRPLAAPAGVEVVTWHDRRYPERLRRLFDPPAAIFVRGRGELLAALDRLPLVAVVGARGPSGYGLEMTSVVVADLVRAGVGIVSGLALGIDAAAHRAAVRTLAQGPCRGPAPPVAVLGCGVGVVHPRSNAALFERVAAAGLIVSEYWWRLPAQAWRFPARNRLIAALSDAVLVVEGKQTSGAKHTASFAVELGCDVLAVPAEAGRPLAALPHQLLREGAGLCESADDVIAALPRARRPPAATEAAAAARVGGDDRLVGPAAQVMDVLRHEDSTVDELALRSGCGVAEVMVAVSRLEIEGLVEAAGAGRFRVVRRPGGPPPGPPPGGR